MTTLAFTRPADRIAESVKMAEDLGFTVLAAPSLEIMDGCQEDYDRVERILEEGKVDYVVFGSGTGVERCVERFGKDRFKELFSKCVIVAIGSNTSAVLQRSGELAHDIMPVTDQSSYGVVDAIGRDVRGKTVLLVRSDSGSDVLLEGLRGEGAEVIDFAAYRLKKVGMTKGLSRIMDGLYDGSVDFMAFTSPMSAESFFEQMIGTYGIPMSIDMMNRVKVVAIGRPTALKLKSLGREPDMIPKNTTFLDILNSIKNFPIDK